MNREVTALPGDKPGVRVSEKEGPGVVWIEGSEFGLGTIEMDIRGRDVPGASFVGIAFHRQDDNTYEGVYLRPFNFRNPDEARRQNAVQQHHVPDYDWPRLRKEFPERVRESGRRIGLADRLGAATRRRQGQESRDLRRNWQRASARGSQAGGHR